MSLPGRWRWCDRPWLCDARKEQNALHTLIHHRRLTPSCGGIAPTATRTMDPARIFTESLTPRPELENSLGQERTSRPAWTMSALPPKADIERHDWHVRFVPEAYISGTGDNIMEHVAGVEHPTLAMVTYE